MMRRATLLFATVIALATAQSVIAQDRPDRAAAALAVHEAQARLRDEIAVLRSLQEAQRQLLAWNGLRAHRGARPVGLAPALCKEEEMVKWCEALPATFGRHEAAR